MAEVLVDVVAAGNRVSPPAKARRATQKAAKTPDAVRNTQAGADCPVGHVNTIAARFCAECGLGMNDTVTTQRVDLDAVRRDTATQSLDAEAKARQHMEAIANNARIEAELPDITQLHDPSEQKILIHFVEDGFTALGKVWLRGETLEIGPDHPRWDGARGWVRKTKQEQVQSYGRVFFDAGPWPYAQHAAGTELPLSNAAVDLWAEARGAVPARQAADHSGAITPW